MAKTPAVVSASLFPDAQPRARLARSRRSSERSICRRTILILGESGTGKDRLARALHDVSSRAGRPFVRIDAANLSDELFESELFGHERGAFTGAVAAKRGLLEVARTGPSTSTRSPRSRRRRRPSSCASSRRRTFRRLGGVASHPFRARLIVSSRRDLSALVEEGLFRDEFFYRIDVVSVRLPRLTDRPEDILPLAREFLKRAARAYGRPARRFTRRAEQALLRHSWPGNVRELLHVVEKAALARGGRRRSRPQDLPAGAFGVARVAARRRGREALDAARAHRRLHRGDSAPRRRQPDAGGQAPGRLPQSRSGNESGKRPGAETEVRFARDGLKSVALCGITRLSSRVQNGTPSRIQEEAVEKENTGMPTTTARAARMPKKELEKYRRLLRRRKPLFWPSWRRPGTPRKRPPRSPRRTSPTRPCPPTRASSSIP